MLCTTAPTTLIATRLTLSSSNQYKKPVTATDVIPATKLYTQDDKLPTSKLPSVVRTATRIMPSSGDNNTTAKTEKMFDKPIFAPGKNNGGKSPSIKKVTDAMAVSIESNAMRFAENLFICHLPVENKAFALGNTNNFYVRYVTQNCLIAICYWSKTVDTLFCFATVCL